jgi:hypothetical protein
MISIYKGPITNLVPKSTVSLQDIVDLVKSDTYRVLCLGIRDAADLKAAKDMKRKLDYITPGGTFTHRHIDGLLQPSGFIVMDFDDVQNLADTKKLLEIDPFIAVLFISPSGSGLKAIVNIGMQDFKMAYTDLSVYFKQTYNLVSDLSGSDITRACFMSYDPECYFNESAAFYKIKGLSPKPKKETFKPESKSELGQLNYVVQQIVNNKVDITSDYSSEWLLIGFSLATYGESARSAWHAISSQNANYEHEYTDKKFDNFLQTTRFTNPAKFYQIAKKYNLDIKSNREPKPDNKKPTTDNRQQKTEDDDEYTKDKTVWYNNKHKYILVKSGKQYKNICDSLIYIKYKTEDERDEIGWVLEVSDNDKVELIEVTHEEFCSASKLKRKFAEKSLALRITDTELSEIHGYLFNDTDYKVAVKIIRFGWHAPSETYLFSNVVWHDGALEAPDEFNIVKVTKKTTPTGGKGAIQYLSVPNPKSIMKKRHELTTNELSFQDFVKLYITAHGYDLSIIPLCFYIFSLVRDIAVKEKSISPILFLKGGAGTGKSSMVRVLTAAFGRKQEGVNLKNKNTEASLVKIMSQTSNAITWFDEYHNEFPYEGILQAAYDNDGYHRSSDTNSIDTNSVDLYSALALTSNFLPDNPIFFSRCLFVPITANQKTEQQRNAFYQLEKHQDTGLGCLTVELLEYRNIIAENFKTAYQDLFNAFREVFKNDKIPERLMANMALIMTPAYIIQVSSKGTINIVNSAAIANEILTEFVNIGVFRIDNQNRIMAESKAIAEFWEITQNLYEQGQIFPDVHFRILGVSGVRELRINFPKIYNLFAMRYRVVFSKSAPDRDTIQTEMAIANGNSSWEEISKAIRFNNDFTTNNTQSSNSVKNCCSISYDLLQQQFGIDLETRKVVQSVFSGK